MTNFIKILLTIIISACLITVAAQSRTRRPSQPQQPSPESIAAAIADSLLDAQLKNFRDACQKFRTEKMGDETFFNLLFSATDSGRVPLDVLKDSLAAVFSSRATRGRFSNELLFQLFRVEQFANHKPLWGGIIDIWSSAAEMPVHSLLASNSEGGRIPIADTLYRVLDAAGRLEPHDLLRYGRVRCLRGDYRAAVRIYCRAIAGDRRIEHAAMTQMNQLLADADSADKVAALADFRRCALALPDVDTVYYRNWLADFYSRHGLFDQEIAILTEFNMVDSPSGRRLADAARTHFTRRRYRHAANSASAAHGRLEDADQRSSIAFVAYQAYMMLGVRDSALAWLRLSDVATKDARIQGIALMQETGHLEEAIVFIDSLAPSLPKDTLLTRQRLFSGEPARALNEILSSASASWKINNMDWMLWRARCMIFSGQVYEVAPVLDSIRFVSTWHGASEILRYRYWLQKLENDHVVTGLWGRLEYMIYTGDLTAATELLRGQRLTGESGEMLVVRLSRALSGAARFAEALEVLELAGSSSGGIKSAQSPEYLYFMADILNETGRRDEARVIANKLLKEFPLDIFAQKARILLARMQ
ncbi:MAG: hypothetical protein LBC70_05170 [Chitinispirillales bacterium]|jgi:tetratricopeptide (TPR) repeat protein|nr:hypothetical protein [Chitinispirillales bacterium]